MSNKPLKRISKELYHYVDDVRIRGKNQHMGGDCINLYGNCTNLYGNCTNLYGDCTDLRGDLDVISDGDRRLNPSILYWAE